MGTNIEEDIKRGLSTREALALTRLAAQNETIITVRDIEEAIDVPYDEAKKVAHNLVRKKWLDRLKRGTYLIVPLDAGEEGEYTAHEFVIASHLADPMYITYWSALNYHGVTEQVPLTVYAATTERVPTREIHDITYRFVTLTESKFFGFDAVAVGSHTVNMASIEKAIADCADHPEHCGGIAELAKAFINADGLDAWRLADYLLTMDNGAAIKRITYLADLYDIELDNRDALEAAFTSGYSKLDPTRDRTGTYSRTYRLALNVSVDELQSIGGSS